MNRRQLIWILLLSGFAVRFLLVFTSLGSTDIIFWTFWSNLVEKRGIAAAYALTPLLNHPPLSLFILHLLRQTADATGTELTDLMRTLQIVADGLSVMALLFIGRKLRGIDPWWLALFYFLTPVAIVVSGFHCNTDPAMLMLILVALAFFVHERDFEAGSAIALAAGIKVPALLLLPFMIVGAKRRWWRVAVAFAAVSLLTWAPTVARGGAVVLRNIFRYHGMAGSWGLPALTRDLSESGGAKFLDPLTRAYLDYGQWILLLALAAVGAAFLWRVLKLDGEESRHETLLVAPLCFLGMLFFAPGFGIQYTLWPLPFIPFLFGRRASVTWSLLTSIFVVVIYTFWSGGFPWWYADALQRRAGELAILRLIHVIWLTVGAYFAAGVWLWLRTTNHAAGKPTYDNGQPVAGRR